MSATAQQIDPMTGLPKTRKKRGAGNPKSTAAFFVVQIHDENGNPVSFDKTQLRVIAIERSAERVLEMVESNENEHAFYLRVMVPAARRGAPSANS
jgi:hypothetical protein